MKFRLILFTLLICMISFAGTRAEIPDPEKSLVVEPEDTSKDVVFSESMNLPVVVCAFKSVCLCDIQVDDALSENWDMDYYYPVDSENARLQSIFNNLFSRKARDGLIQYYV